ncbi:fused toxin protein-like [Ahaetulla prasina]|uniref:fused toxin protein-like n=1 Tax=Ahaetulla prasina TaxID=499056 RepID=UPI00264974B0|nr:fused toxin protein-like [Ahaetulla prasina]
MRSGHSLLLLLSWAAFALWSPQHSVSGLFEGGCSTFPNNSKQCGEPKHRFFYNVTSKSCEPFIYYGCPGNRNRYYTIEECQRYCGQIEKSGFCPPSPRGIMVPCLANCLHDGNCQETDKCCSYGCALNCMKPITGETQSQVLWLCLGRGPPGAPGMPMEHIWRCWAWFRAPGAHQMFGGCKPCQAWWPVG